MATLQSNTVNPSIYGNEEALLDLSKTYLDLDNVSTLKSGLFGYLTGAMARVAGEGVHHRNVLYNENFLNTASMPSSIYNYAKIYDYTVGLAKPSQCRILLGMYMDDIRNVLGEESGVITLSPNQLVYMGSTPFVLGGAIRIALLDGRRISAEYDLDQMNFLQPNQGEYIRTYITPQVVDNTGATRTVVYMELHAYQAQPRAMQFQIISSSALESTFYRVPVPEGEQLAKFRVMYRLPTESEFREIPAYFNDTTIPEDPEYCFFSFTAHNELEIYFSPLPGSFRPAYNSQLRVELLATTGREGNFDYTGIPVTAIEGHQIATLLEVVTQPSGGENSETLVETKKGIMRKILERKNIIIESDLENHLTSMVDRTTVNSSMLKFIKRRDDIQTRLFGGFLMIRDGAGRVVPTNTVDIDFEAADLESRGWSIRPGTLFIHDPKNNIFRLVEPGEYPDRMADDPGSFVYCTPLLMQFRVKAFPHMVYYQNQADIDMQLQALPGDVLTADSFIANSLTIKRNSAFENTYQIDFPLSTNIAAESMGDKCLVRLQFLDAKGESRGYMEASHLSGTNIFRALLATEDMFNDDSEMLFTRSLWDENTNTLLPSVPLPESIHVRIELYYDMANPNTNVRHVQRGNRVFQLVNAYKTTDEVSLYRSLERVMSSGMYVTEDGTFHCDNVPVVGASFFLNPRIGMETVKVIERYHTAILDVFDLLHNNTNVDVKLYNTYGPSRAFNLDRVNMSIVMEVRPRGRTSDLLRNLIKQRTSEFIQSCNENTRSRFSISNLTTFLERNIADIAFLRFISLNGVSIHNTEHIYSEATMERDNKRIPEYLNSHTKVLSTIEQDPYVPDVEVRFI